MKKLILLGFVALALNAYGIMSANADTAYLVIPEQRYTNSVKYPIRVITFDDWQYYSGEFRCMVASQVVHQVHPAPTFSQCTYINPLRWKWR